MSGIDLSVTRDASPPATPGSDDPGKAVLIVAFPAAGVLPLATLEPVIGRRSLAARGLPDPEVSGKHARVVPCADGVEIEDLGSRNGTFIDGQRLPPRQPRQLDDGAVLRLGRTLMVYRQSFRGDLEPAPPIGDMVGPFGLRDVSMALEAIALMRPKNVLIRGETGTGKEMAAWAVATRLGRNTPYVAVNVASIPSGVFEGQVFGHVAGAFSGAKKAHKGLVAAHDGGAVFFDEIGELPLELQPKLLRLLENREIQPVGGERPITVDVAIIVATHRDLEAMVAAGHFREDLLARVASLTLRLPPLRQRSEDVFAILEAIARRGGACLRPAEVEVEAVERMMRDPWPTNVRGLQALWTRLQMIDGRPGVRAWAVREALGRAPEISDGASSSPEPAPLTRESVAEALAACAHNESQTARRLGVSRGKLRRFLAKHFDGHDLA